MVKVMSEGKELERGGGKQLQGVDHKNLTYRDGGIGEEMGGLPPIGEREQSF